MSLENEYYTISSELKSELDVLKQFQDQDITKMSEDQLQAHYRGIRSVESSIDETEKVLDEIKIELYDHIYNDGEVSRKTIKSLLGDITNDIFFKEQEDDYDLEVLQGKQEFLKSLL